ncbi:M4 family metallopeptidase [Deinococcus deserti]|uniref:Putative bacillolysin n=1 Tax=Deinococcus deserti (strain DSM 17065 / CIP 109153 / LMG 22923 / VCD115) TaxID=546414 RepID=C1CXB4_DEIDV|nr:M4 family metallopeptidase [Deinococcus deserti]ACO46831.1 putative bacillolysin, precursor [Deinococcus deserti VCD115]
MQTKLSRQGLTALVTALLLGACGQQVSQDTSLSAQGGNGKPTTGQSTAAARVFLPNPVQSSGNQTLVDDGDSASAVPASAYYNVTLSERDGSGYLSGKWAKVINETGTPVYGTGPFHFTRDQDGFEQVMAYFWVTEAQKYLQTLGFGSELKPVNMQQQLIKVSQYGVDNSYMWDKHNWLRLGKGGVDDAEDGEVIVHEYGHAVHAAQVPGFGSSLEAGAIGEAFGDYLAMTVGYAVSTANGAPVRAPLGCIMDWDAVSYTSTEPHCLRRIDTNKHYPEDLRGQVHADGMIWSRALWDIWNALGARTADRIVINAQFGFAPDTSFAAAAEQTVRTAQAMYGRQAAATVKKAFVDRGILQ